MQFGYIALFAFQTDYAFCNSPTQISRVFYNLLKSRFCDSLKLRLIALQFAQIALQFAYIVLFAICPHRALAIRQILRFWQFAHIPLFAFCPYYAFCKSPTQTFLVFCDLLESRFRLLLKSRFWQFAYPNIANFAIRSYHALCKFPTQILRFLRFAHIAFFVYRPYRAFCN